MGAITSFRQATEPAEAVRAVGVVEAEDIGGTNNAIEMREDNRR